METRSVARLALADMRHEPAHVLCIVALIAGVLAPLMMLFAIKTGVMETLIGALRDNPNMRRIEIIGNHDFGERELADLRGWPDLAFVSPEERSIARNLYVRKPGARSYQTMTVVSSAPGDPLLPQDMQLAPDEIAVSAGLAAQLDLREGATLEARATRGDPPTARLALELKVRHVVQRGWLQGRAALVPHQTVSTIEAFYDNYALPQSGVTAGRDLGERGVHYEGFRLFARDIREVAAVEKRLESALGVTVQSRVGEIEPLLQLDRDIDRALTVLVVCAGAGLAAALTALFWANVERKSLVLSVLALMGMPPQARALFPVIQAAAYATLGAIAALLVFLLGVGAFEILFASHLGAAGGRIAPIQPLVLALVFAGLLAVALAASAIAARRAAAADAATVLRSGG